MVLGVWARWAEMVGSDWVGLILFATIVGSVDWLALSWAPLCGVSDPAGHVEDLYQRL